MAASDVAVACGVSAYALDTKFRPDDWACPRDFYLARRGTMFFAQESLPRLADSLAAGGETEAARLLREYAAKLPLGTGRGGPPEVGELRPVARVAAGAEQLEALNLAGGKRHASDREAVPSNWAAEWEGARE